MLIDTHCGNMEEFTCGEYTHRFAVDMSQPVEQREFQRKVEAEKFDKYVDAHIHGRIVV